MAVSRMRQTLLDDHFHFPSRRAPSRSFLDLPPSIRERIYDGTLRWQTPSARKLMGSYFLDNLTVEFEDAASLMLTCRTFHIEIQKLIYSQNTLFIDGTTLDGLEELRDLSAQNLASLSKLVVQLDLDHATTPSLCSTRGYGHEHCVRCYHMKDQFLAELSFVRRSNLQQWHDVLNDILPYLPQSGLHIGLIYDMESVDIALARNIARRLLLPLHSRLTLASCFVHLGRTSSLRLRELAEEVASQATGTPCLIQQRLGFLDLPHEIRVQILSYTDLVTPIEEVEWRPGQGYWTYGRHRCGSLPMYGTRQEYGIDFRRGAYAASNSRCKCWLPPQPLFLLCRTLRLEAEQVFFEQNRIIIKPGLGIDRLADHTPPVLDASYYLTKVIPTHALRHLRVLEIVFSPLKDVYLQEQEPAYLDWISTLDFVKNKLAYPNLILRVVFSSWSPYLGDYDARYEPGPSEKATTEIYESYKRTLAPLSTLRRHGLAHLQLDLAFPHWLHRRPGFLDGLRGRLSATSVEQAIQVCIMGEGYSATVARLSDSLWKLVWRNETFEFDSVSRIGYNDSSIYWADGIFHSPYEDMCRCSECSGSESIWSGDVMLRSPF